MASLRDNINQAISDFNGIEKAIEECGVDVPYGTDTKDYGDKVRQVKQKAIEDGKNSEWSKFWDDFQNNGERDSYVYSFYGTGWTENTFRPKYDMRPTGSVARMFSESAINGDMDALLKEIGVTLDLSNSVNVAQSFLHLVGTTKLPPITVKSDVTVASMFANSTSLKSVTITFNGKARSLVSTFSGCTALENLQVSGDLQSSGLNVQWCPLTHDSLMSIINTLHDFGSETSARFVTFGEANTAKLSAAELQIVQDKGWTVK